MKARRWLVISALALLAAGLVWRWRDSVSPVESVSEPPPPRVVSAPREDGEEDFAAIDAAVRSKVLADWKELRAWLATNPPEEEVRQRLEELRELWVTLDPNGLAAVLRELLERGEDAPTGLTFRVGTHGMLSGWNTLRVFLLDVLTAADPESSAAIAKRLLDSTSSAEEFAVALRCLTHEGPGRADARELSERLDVLLGRGEWSRSPGFAEALDLPRAIATSRAAGQLMAWQGDRNLRSMALHEFAADHPSAVLEALAGESGRALDPQTRATLMARARADDPAQLAVADAYLRQPGLSPAEATAFLKAFPLASATTGDRLYADSPAPFTRERIVAGDRAALDQVRAWLEVPDLQGVRPDLEALEKRLEVWVKQAGER